MKKFISAFLLLITVSASATNYYVTQSGAGTGNGSVGNPESVAMYNADFRPTGGDTVFFSGTITSEIDPSTSGTGNGSGRLVLDASGANLNPLAGAHAIYFGNRSYLTFTQGGSFSPGSGGVFSAHVVKGTMGALDAGGNLIDFGSSPGGHDITVDGVTTTAGSSTGLTRFINLRNCYNFTVQNCYVTGIEGFVNGDSLNDHDITIQNNYVVTNVNTIDQSDVIAIGDAYNVTIQGNYLKNQSPGANVGRHNDIIQNYKSGSSFSGNPYGWIIRYNLIEAEATSGSGDNSFLMIETMNDGGSTPALKVYGNVFVGDSDTVANNGAAIGAAVGGNYYVYNNTIITSGGRPGNTFFVGVGGTGTLFCRNNLGYDPTGSNGTYLNWVMLVGAQWNNNWFFNWGNPSSTYTGPNGASNTDPLLNNYAGKDFSLKPASPAKGKGDSSIGAEFSQGIQPGATWPNPTLVPRGTSWDVGAFQSPSVVIAPSATMNPITHTP